MSNDELRAAFGEVSDQDLILIRGKLAVAKFFVSEKDTTLLQKISELLLRRLTTSQGIEDVANMLSKTVNGEKLLPYIQSFSMGKYDVS